MGLFSKKNKTFNFEGLPNNYFNNVEAVTSSSVIKQALKKSNTFDIYNNLFGDFVKFNESDKRNCVIYDVLQENGEFFTEEFKTNILNNIIKRVVSNVMDDYTLTINDEERNDINISINGKTKTLLLNDKVLCNIAGKCLLYNKCYVLFDTDKYDNIIDVKLFNPWQAFEYKDKTTLLLFENNEPIIKEYYEDKIATYKRNNKNEWELSDTQDHNVNFNLIHKVSCDYNLISEGVLETILSRSYIISAMNKEILTGTQQIFSDATYTNSGYQYGRLVYRHIDTPEMAQLGDDKPFWEVVSGEMRSDKFKEMLEINTDIIASNLMLDKLTIGMETTQTTATEIRTRTITAINTINDLKTKINEAINLLLNQFSEQLNIKLTIAPYKNNDKLTLIEMGQKALASGCMSVERVVEMVNTNLTSEQKLYEVCLVKIENNKKLTKDEYDYAYSTGLIDSDYGDAEL